MCGKSIPLPFHASATCDGILYDEQTSLTVGFSNSANHMESMHTEKAAISNSRLLFSFFFFFDPHCPEAWQQG